MVVFTHVLLSGEELGEVAVVQLSGSKWVASLWTPQASVFSKWGGLLLLERLTFP